MSNGRFAGISYKPDVFPSEADQALVRRTRWVRNSSGAEIAANSSVQFDLTVATDFLGHHVELFDGSASSGVQFAGVSDVAIPDGEFGEVHVRGSFCYVATSGVSAGDPVKVSTTVDGTLDTGTPGTHHIVGTALEDTAATVAGQSYCFLFQG